MSAEAVQRLRGLSATHPEWNPWLAVVGETLAAVLDPRWEESLPARPRRESRSPLLAHASIVLSSEVLRRWIKQLFSCAARAGTPELATLAAAPVSQAAPLRLFRAALVSDAAELRQIAGACRVNENAFYGVADLLPVPLLHASRRRWTEPATAFWAEGYCPTCGAWPAFAEARGIEKARYLCCARCGQDWQTHELRCIYCGNNDHERLMSLVPQNGSSTRFVEVCKSCAGYLKFKTTLQGTDALDIMIDDLASVDLDIAAVEQGYHRPEGLGHSIDPTLENGKGGGQFFRWSR